MRQEKTKGRILDSAIDLFSAKGYDAVSVREIAAAVGIRAASLYKHYENKEAILESIFDQFRMMMQATHDLEENMLQLPAGNAEVILTASFLAFRDFIYQPRMLKITRIINLEQGRNAQVRAFFLQELVEKPLDELERTFAGMISSGMLKPVDALMLARTYHAAILSTYYTHNILRAEVDLTQVEEEMLAFIRFFCEVFGEEPSPN